MRLILLGTTGYHPNDRRHTPCLLLPECGVMLDAGTATYRAGEYLTGPELDIFLTHAHLDHVVGLTYLFSVMRVHPLRADHAPRAAGEAGGGRRASVFRGVVSRAAAVGVPPAGRELCAARRRPA